MNLYFPLPCGSHMAFFSHEPPASVSETRSPSLPLLAGFGHQHVSFNGL